MIKKKCLECGEAFEGRSDRKFCNHHCRIAYNNNIRSQHNQSIRHIDKILHNNFAILKKIKNTGQVKISRSELLKTGYDFTYFTNIYTTNSGKVYYYCYQFGYRNIGEKDQILIVEKSSWV